MNSKDNETALARLVERLTTVVRSRDEEITRLLSTLESCRAERDAAVAKYHAEIKRGRIACEGIVSIVEKERDSARAEVERQQKHLHDGCLNAVAENAALLVKIERIKSIAFGEMEPLNKLDAIRKCILSPAPTTPTKPGQEKKP